MNRIDDHADRDEDRDELRGLLRDAVSHVEPRLGIDAIRSRTAAPRARWSWTWAAGGAVAATAATIAAVSVLSSGLGGSNEVAPQPEPTGATPLRTVSVYFVGDTGGGTRLFSEQRRVFAPVALQEALADAVQGVAFDPDYTSPWPSGQMLRGARMRHGVITIDLDGTAGPRPHGMSPGTARAAVQQLVLTAQSATRHRFPVRFLLDGRPTATVLGERVGHQVTGRRDDSVLAAVSIRSPQQDATVGSPFTVTGQAATFEANVQWELTQGDTVVRRGFTTARECCTLSPYSFKVSAPPGVYTLVVHDEDMSDGEGVGSFQDTKSITVR